MSYNIDKLNVPSAWDVKDKAWVLIGYRQRQYRLSLEMSEDSVEKRI
jgi:hypothetical protein